MSWIRVVSGKTQKNLLTCSEVQTDANRQKGGQSHPACWNVMHVMRRRGSLITVRFLLRLCFVLEQSSLWAGCLAEGEDPLSPLQVHCWPSNRPMWPRWDRFKENCSWKNAAPWAFPSACRFMWTVPITENGYKKTERLGGGCTFFSSLLAWGQLCAVSCFTDLGSGLSPPFNGTVMAFPLELHVWPTPPPITFYLLIN